MDLEITFNGKSITTPVYIKMDAPEQLLLSEGVCRQLNILTYHPDVQVWRGGRKRVSAPPPRAQVPTVRLDCYSLHGYHLLIQWLLQFKLTKTSIEANCNVARTNS